jgi:SPP1 family predicted phage head-tail adaptor
LLFREIISLITVTEGTNDIGDPIKILTKRENIFADKQSIRQSEFYQAMAAGLKPELTFIIRTCEYNQEPMLEFNLKTYNIIRTYEKENEFIELICEGVINNATT